MRGGGGVGGGRRGGRGGGHGLGLNRLDFGGGGLVDGGGFSAHSRGGYARHGFLE